MSYPLSEEQAERLRDPDYIQALREQAHVVSQQKVLPGQPETLWPIVSWNDLLNQAVGMQITDNHYLTRPSGQTWMHAKTKNGGLPVAYEELPYEWSAPHRYHVERLHSKGPLKYLRFGVDLKAINAQETEVTCTIAFVSYLPVLVAKPLVQKEQKAFMRLFERLAERAATGFDALRIFHTESSAQITQWVQQWAQWVPQAEVRQALADYIARAPERLAYRLRPFELAKSYQLDPLEVLKACLYLARAGFLHLQWDCRCPSCKGPKETQSQLQSLQAMAYCPTCAVSYGLAFDQNIELTFQPDSRLRPTQERTFCAGSPGNTPHLAWQQMISAGKTREFKLDLASGGYALRSLSSENEVVLWLGDYPGVQAEAELSLSKRFDLPLGSAETLILCPGASLRIHNHNAYESVVMLESLDWQADAVTAARVQAVQAFHDLFPDQVLSPSERLPLQSQIILQLRFANLDRLSQEGDPGPELLAWAKQSIQAHEGAVVPQGEAETWGIFATPFEALSAAWELQQGLDELGFLYDEALILQMAVAAGPCDVLNAGGYLNYTGALCEALAHVLSLSPPDGALWIAQALWEDETVQSILADMMGSGEDHGAWRLFANGEGR